MILNLGHSSEVTPMQKLFRFQLLLFFTLSFSLGYGQQDPEKLRQLLVKGKVQSMTVMGYKYDIEGNLDPKGIKKTHERYDKKGNITMEITYNTTGGIREKVLNKFDKQHRKIAVIKRDGNEQLVEKYTISYTPSGKVAARKGEKKGVPFEIAWKYNRDDNPVSQTRLENGKEVWHIDYSHDQEGNQVKEEFFGPKRFQTLYEYDDFGRKISNTSYADTIQGFRYTYTYDEKGRKTKEEQFNGKDELMNTWMYTYSDAGKVKSIDLYSDYLGYLQQRWIYKYDGDGKVLEIKIFDKEEGLPVFTSKYLYKVAKP